MDGDIWLIVSVASRSDEAHDVGDWKIHGRKLKHFYLIFAGRNDIERTDVGEYLVIVSLDSYNRVEQ